MIIGLDCDGTCDPTLQAVADAVTAALAVDPTPERVGESSRARRDGPVTHTDSTSLIWTCRSNSSISMRGGGW